MTQHPLIKWRNNITFTRHLNSVSLFCPMLTHVELAKLLLLTFTLYATYVHTQFSCKWIRSPKMWDHSKKQHSFSMFMHNRLPRNQCWIQEVDKIQFGTYVSPLSSLYARFCWAFFEANPQVNMLLYKKLCVCVYVTVSDISWFASAPPAGGMSFTNPLNTLLTS